jgi:hypothetical protein
MRRRLFNWQGQRFLYLGLEGEPGRPLAQQASDLFRRAGTELATLGLSLLRNTVRTRIFGRTAAARTAGSQARGQALVGRSRAAGSSYICVPHFCSAADVGLDLFAMAAPAGNPPRHVTEHEPEQSFIRHMVWGPMVFLSGMTCERYPTLRRNAPTSCRVPAPCCGRPAAIGATWCGSHSSCIGTRIRMPSWPAWRRSRRCRWNMPRSSSSRVSRGPGSWWRSRSRPGGEVTQAELCTAFLAPRAGRGRHGVRKTRIRPGEGALPQAQTR